MKKITKVMIGYRKRVIVGLFIGLLLLPATLIVEAVEEDFSITDEMFNEEYRSYKSIIERNIADPKFSTFSGLSLEFGAIFFEEGTYDNAVHANIDYNDFEPVFEAYERVYGVENGQDVVRVGAFDLGSTGLKFALADVDIRSKKILKIIYQKTVPMEFKITEESLVSRLAVIVTLRSLVRKYYPAPKIIFRGVGTAGLRRATILGEKFEKVINLEGGVQFSIVDQEGEAKLAFYGASLIADDFNPEKAIVWDIGGGSMQMIGEESDGSFKVIKTRIAARTFYEEFMDKVKNEPDPNRVSPNPIGLAGLTEGQLLAQDLIVRKSGRAYTSINVKFNPIRLSDIQWVREKVERGGVVYGVGSIHRFVALHYVNYFSGKNEPYYTFSELYQTNEYLASLDDDEIHSISKSAPREAIPSIVTSLIMVEGYMGVLGIPQVNVIQVSNTTGIMAEVTLEENEKLMSEQENAKETVGF